MTAAANKGRTTASHTFYMPVNLFEIDDLGDAYVSSNAIILIVWGGEGTLLVDGHEQDLSRGTTFLSNALTQMELRIESRSPLRGIGIEYRCLTPDGSSPEGLHYPIPLQRVPAGLLRLAVEFKHIWMEPQLSSPFQAQQLFAQLLQGLSEELAARQQPSHSWVDQSLHYMDAHYNEELTREQMAEQAGVSPEHFSRTFRKHTGRTFNAHLTLLRIRSAQQLLLIGTPNLNTLAQQVGYKEGLYLSRKFKESVGLSPSAYRHSRKTIVTLDSNHTASLIALDITPELGVYTSWLEQFHSKKKLKSRQKFNPYIHTPATYYEALASVRPDLIISYSHAEVNKSLLPLAPVMELPLMTMSWRDQFILIADIVNKRLKAEEWLAKHDQMMDAVNHRLDRDLGARGTAIVWEIGSHAAYCFSSSFGRGCQILYDDLGFQPPGKLLEQGIVAKGYIEADIEAIASYPADYIIFTSMPSCPDSRLRFDRLLRSPKWRSLDAVKHNRVYYLNEPELFYGYDPLSTQAQLRELLNALTPHEINLYRGLSKMSDRV